MYEPRGATVFTVAPRGSVRARWIRWILWSRPGSITEASRILAPRCRP